MSASLEQTAFRSRVSVGFGLLTLAALVVQFETGTDRRTKPVLRMAATQEARRTL